MRDLAIQASSLFLELFPSGEALSPCGRFLGSPSAGEGEVAGADERLWGLGGPFLPPPLPPPLPPLSPIWGVLVGVWPFCAFSFLPLVFVTFSFLYVTFVLVVTTFATVTTGDGTPEMVLMGHSFPIFGVLPSFHLQHTTTVVVAVRGMTRSPLVIDRRTVEQRGCTCFRFNLIHGTHVIPSFTTTLVGVIGTFRSFPFAKFGGRGTTSTQVFLEEILLVGVILPLKG